MNDRPAVVAYVTQLEARLAEVADWVAVAEENAYWRSLADAGVPLNVQYRQVRNARGLSQRALSALTGVRQSTISRLEVGGCETSLPTLYAVAEGLDSVLLLVPREEA